tara:strand:- start:387 stop:746 length:360 start_codon:yes stop_codon:yes gene_type:complete
MTSKTDSQSAVEKLGVALEQGLITQTQHRNLVRDIELEQTYSSVIKVGQAIVDRALVTESWKADEKIGKKAGSITKLDPTEFPKLFNTAKPDGYTMPNGKRVKFIAGGRMGSLVKVVEI